MYAANAAYSLTGGDDKYFKASNTENLGANVSIDKSKFWLITQVTKWDVTLIQIHNLFYLTRRSLRQKRI